MALRVAAHRGGAAVWPENSLLAFRRAIGLGVPLLELDVHQARDGGIIVIHDRTLERTTTGTGPVADRTTDELTTLRLKDVTGAVTAERLPTLDEVLAVAALSGVSLLLEVKGPGRSVSWARVHGRVRGAGGPRYDGLEGRLLDRLARTGMTERTTVMAFNPDVVRDVRRLAPSIRTTALLDAGHFEAPAASAAEMLDVVRDLGATDIGLEHVLAQEVLVGAARERGLAVGVWTVNDVAEMRRCAALGVDIITTDRPDLALRILGDGASGANS